MLEQVLKDLQQDGWINQAQFNHLIGSAAAHRKKGLHPLESIAERNWQSAVTPSFSLNLERLTRWLAEKNDLPYLHIDPLKTDFASLTRFISYAYASRFNILPIASDTKSLTIATAEPGVREWEKDLAHTLKIEIRRVIANPTDVNHYLHEFFKLRYSVQSSKADKEQPISNVQNFEQLLELGKRDNEPDAGDQHIVHIVDWLLQYAFEQRASDIHLEPRRENAKIRFRIDGILHQVHEIPTRIMAAIVSRFKMLGRMNLAERRRPQDGRIKTVVPETGNTVELRLSSMPTAFGEKLVTRIFDSDVLLKNVKELGFTKHDITLWDKMVTQPHGIVLVTGPTGSGKTSTLYSALKHLSRPEINVCTIEDPIEIVEPEFNQMQVHHAIGLDFASGVRTLLRQDPDIIMVGEIRDKETASVSVQAALTGHLVLSTLHTNDAPSAITRLLDIGVPSYLINASLLGVAAQRLVRVLCPHCKQAAAPKQEQWDSLTAPLRLHIPKRTFQPKGCDDCRQTGFRGRIGLYEIMVISPQLEKLASSNASLAEIRRCALKEGMRPLRISGAQKIAAGLTTFEEVFNVVALDESK
ncbi:MAG: type II/IV secretion system protein [Gammaproteobacteria bacterium]|nr:type II/IV secretion system protein [Gammaproteobacteria bacterium]